MLHVYVHLPAPQRLAAFDGAVHSVPHEPQLLGSNDTLVQLPPQLVSADPPQGDVLYFTNLVVTFSEGVSGVDAGDLLINGVPASTPAPQGGPFAFVGGALLNGAGSAGWQFVLSTSNLTAGNTYAYTINLNDGTSIPFQFKLN